MAAAAFEGIVENGLIKLDPSVHLPEKTRVYVLVPKVAVEPVARLATPRLKHPEDAADFQMEVVEELSNAGL